MIEALLTSRNAALHDAVGFDQEGIEMYAELADRAATFLIGLKPKERTE